MSCHRTRGLITPIPYQVTGNAPDAGLREIESELGGGLRKTQTLQFTTHNSFSRQKNGGGLNYPVEEYHGDHVDIMDN